MTNRAATLDRIKVATVKTGITLPTAAHAPFSITAQGQPVIVNGKWEIPLGESATFKQRRFLWWRWWARI